MLSTPNDESPANVEAAVSLIIISYLLVCLMQPAFFPITLSVIDLTVSLSPVFCFSPAHALIISVGTQHILSSFDVYP